MKRVTRSLRIRSDMKNLRIIENAVDEITNLLGIKQENYGKSWSPSWKRLIMRSHMATRPI